MDALKEYNVDSLSYIDREYDNPAVKSQIDSLIRTEMATFSRSSKNYLSNVPYPTNLKYSISKISFDKFDMKRYAVEGPSSAMENNIQAWKASISNAKSQLENQANRLLNLELAEKHSSDVWLQHNNMIEKSEKMLLNRNEQIYKQIQIVNFNRKDKQENARIELNKMLRRRDESVIKSWQIEASCIHMEYSLNQQNKRTMSGGGHNDDDQHNKKLKLNH